MRMLFDFVLILFIIPVTMKSGTLDVYFSLKKYSAQLIYFFCLFHQSVIAYCDFWLSWILKIIYILLIQIETETVVLLLFYFRP